jgi:hypothetical protein
MFEMIFLDVGVDILPQQKEKCQSKTNLDDSLISVGQLRSTQSAV